MKKQHKRPTRKQRPKKATQPLFRCGGCGLAFGSKYQRKQHKELCYGQEGERP